MSYSPEIMNWTASDGTPLASANAYWRIIEYSSYDFDGSSPHYDTGTGRYSFDSYPWFGAGRVAADGSLTGLPTSYTASGDVPFVIPPGSVTPPADFTMHVACQTGCLNENDGLIYWHPYSSSDPAGVDQLFNGYKLTSPASDWPA